MSAGRGAFPAPDRKLRTGKDRVRVYDSADPNLDADSQFGVTRALIGNFVERGSAYALEFAFVRETGESWRPKPPISRKVDA